MDKLQWGILGTGNIAQQFCTGLAGCKTGTAAAVGSRRRESAEAFAQRFGIPKSYANYEGLIADPHIDAVYVSLPNSLHCEWTLRAIQAGKHVLCEKPIAASENEAKKMFDAAREAGKVLIEAFMYRAHPQTREVMEKLRASAIGEVKLVRTSFCFRTNKVEGNIRFDRDLAGGALMDIGCYCISFSQMAARSDVVEMAASGLLHRGGVDEIVAGSLKFANGVIAGFTCGMTVQADNTAYIFGTDGHIEIPRPWKPLAEDARYKVNGQEYVVNAGRDVFGVEADVFAASVKDGAPPFFSEAESLATIKILDKLRNVVAGFSPRSNQGAG
jgi:predicted dehydrogenase